MTKKEQFIEKYGEKRYDDILGILDEYRNNYELGMHLLNSTELDECYVKVLLKRTYEKHTSVKDYLINSVLCTEEEFDIYEEWYSGRA